MEMQGSRRIAAPRAVVWAALTDPEVMRAAIPGCQSLTGTAADGFEAVVRPQIGPIGATFRGRLTLADVVPAESYTLSAEGGGSAGFARGDAAVRLADDGDGTLLSYDVTARVDGKLAQLGSRLVDGAAGRLVEEFFAGFQAAVEAPAAGATEPASAARRPGWFRRVLGG